MILQSTQCSLLIIIEAGFKLDRNHLPILLHFLSSLLCLKLQEKFQEFIIVSDTRMHYIEAILFTGTKFFPWPFKPEDAEVLSTLLVCQYPLYRVSLLILWNNFCWILFSARILTDLERKTPVFLFVYFQYEKAQFGAFEVTKLQYILHIKDHSSPFGLSHSLFFKFLKLFYFLFSNEFIFISLSSFL